jgi:hypothetical protein
VLDHETGHAVQARADVDAPSVVRELQADCFAGSWTHFAETSGPAAVELTDGALATILTLRDQPGRSAAAQQAHGLGFDRVNAFQTGYEQGAANRVRFPQQGVVTTELPFRTGGSARADRRSRDRDVAESGLGTGSAACVGLPATGEQAVVQRDCFTGAWPAHLAGSDPKALNCRPATWTRLWPRSSPAAFTTVALSPEHCPCGPSCSRTRKPVSELGVVPAQRQADVRRRRPRRIR